MSFDHVSGTRSYTFKAAGHEYRVTMPASGTITFVPSVHFSPAHRRRVRETIREREPDLVAVELCERRFEQIDQHARLGSEDLARDMPPGTAATYRTLRVIQQTAARMYGLDPGQTDMETAIETAAELDVDVALIDEPITESLSRLTNRVGIETIPKALTRAQLMDPAAHLAPTTMLLRSFDRIESGEDVQPVIDYMRRLLPEVTEVLIDQRDRAMARRLHTLRRQGHDVVAVIGAGHHLGIQRELNELDARDAEPTGSVPIRTPTRQVTNIPVE